MPDISVRALLGLDRLQPHGRAGKAPAADRAEDLESISLLTEQRAGRARVETDLLTAADRLRDRLASADETLRAASVSTEVAAGTVEETRVVSETVEVVTPATSALQSSIEFSSASTTVADAGSQFVLAPAAAGGTIQIDVGLGGASLTDLAQLVNEDAENGGRVVASVVESGGRYRLEIETTGTGSSAGLNVESENVSAPIGGILEDPPIFGPYAFFDAAAARVAGTDESVDSVVQTRVETVSESAPSGSEVAALPESDRFALEREIVEFVAALDRLDASERSDPPRSLVARLLGDQNGGAHAGGSAATSAYLVARFASTGLDEGAHGLSRAHDGRLVVDRAALADALDADPRSVLSIFAAPSAEEPGAADPVEIALARIEQQTAVWRSTDRRGA